MNWIEGMKQAIIYIEDHLEGEIEYEKVASIMGYSVYHFQRLFMLIAGVSLAEYIRNRRLTKAAVDLQSGAEKVIEVALKYGYSSPTSFNRAFQGVHGLSPSEAKKVGATVKAFPPITFEFAIKGGDMLEYRIETKESFRLVGYKIQTTTENGLSYQEIPTLWRECQETLKIQALFPLMTGEIIGLLGVSDYNPQLSTSEFDYYIGAASASPTSNGLAETVVEGGTWAIFPCQNQAEIASLQQQVITEWLPSFGYEFANLPDVELYKPDGTAEVWLPIIKNK